MATPAWRSFEELVSRIEHALAGQDVTVTSPDHIPCITTGTPREVDVSIRTRVGSAEILVTVECRDRSAVQDVTWIEQLATKKKNIGAAKTIAVAASGFSAEAKRIARENGIDLRILDEITEEDVKSWMPMVGMVHVFKDCELIGDPEIVCKAEPGEEGQEITIPDSGSGPHSFQPVFRGPNNEPLSLNDIWLRADDQMKLFDKVPKDDKDHFTGLRIKPSDTLLVCSSKGDRPVVSITMRMRLRWKHERLSLSQAQFTRYRAEGAGPSLPEQTLVEFETTQANGQNLRVGFLMQQGCDQMRALLRILPAAADAVSDPSV